MKKLFQPFCFVCYSCNLSTKPVGIRAAERLATSHLRQFGHQTGINPIKQKATENETASV